MIHAYKKNTNSFITRFTTNSKWYIITSFNLILSLKLFSYPPVNNLLFKKYYKNIIDIIFIIRE